MDLLIENVILEKNSKNSMIGEYVEDYGKSSSRIYNENEEVLSPKYEGEVVSKNVNLNEPSLRFINDDEVPIIRNLPKPAMPKLTIVTISKEKCGNSFENTQIYIDAPMYDRIKLDARSSSKKAKQKLTNLGKNPKTMPFYNTVHLKPLSIKIEKGAIYQCVDNQGCKAKSFLHSITDGVVNLKRKHVQTPGHINQDIKQPPTSKRPKLSKLQNEMIHDSPREFKIANLNFHWFCLDCEGCTQTQCDHYNHSRRLIRGDLNIHFDITGHSGAQPVNNFVKTEGICSIKDLAYDPGYSDIVGNFVKEYPRSVTNKSYNGNVYFKKTTKCKKGDCAFTTIVIENMFNHIRDAHISMRR